MTSTTATCNLQVLSRLGELYPSVRFGQLFEFIATLTGEESPGEALGCLSFDLLFPFLWEGGYHL